MRVQAELLLEDADNFGSDAYEDRTHEQSISRPVHHALTWTFSALGGTRTPNLLIRSQMQPGGLVRRRPPRSEFSGVAAPRSIPSCWLVRRHPSSFVTNL